MKKTIRLGTMAMVGLTPIIAAVSCGNKKETKEEKMARLRKEIKDLAETFVNKKIEDWKGDKWERLKKAQKELRKLEGKNW